MRSWEPAAIPVVFSSAVARRAAGSLQNRTRSLANRCGLSKIVENVEKLQLLRSEKPQYNLELVWLESRWAMVVVHIAAGALGVVAGLYLFSGYGLAWMLLFSVLTGNAAILLSALAIAAISGPAPSLRASQESGADPA